MKADIIQMARNASFTENSGFAGCFVCNPDSLKRFAQMVASECAEIADIAEPYKSADLIKKHFGVEE